MKIFLDTADYKALAHWLEAGIIDGVTTNPTHLSTAGGDPKRAVQEICTLMKGKDVSVEVTQSEPEAVYKQAKEIAALADNVVVKVPCHAKYYAVIKKLVDDGIKINVTLVFTLIQSMLMCKLGVRYISPFVGRWDDIDVDGGNLLFEIRQMIDEYAFKTELLAASLRHVRHVHQAIVAGADVATVPVSVLEKMTKHPLTDQGIAKFDADWQKLGIKTFP